MTNRIEIKFDERFIDKIKSGEKYTTIRPANKLRGSLTGERFAAISDITCVYKHPDLELSITKVETTNLLEIIRNPSFWLRGEGLSDYHNQLEFLALWQEFYGGTEYDMSNNPAVVVIYFSCVHNQKVEEQNETNETTMKDQAVTLSREHVIKDVYSEQNARINAVIGAALHLNTMQSKITIKDIADLLGDRYDRVKNICKHMHNMAPIYFVGDKLRWKNNRTHLFVPATWLD